MSIWQEDTGLGKNNEEWGCTVDKGPVIQDLRGPGLFFVVRAVRSYWEGLSTGSNMVGG